MKSKSRRSKDGRVAPSAALLDACRRGDQVAWAELDTLFRRRVFGFCYAQTRDPQKAEDWTQEILLRVSRALPAFVDGNFSAWVFAIARHWAADQWRRPPDPVTGAEEVDEDPDRRPDPGEEIERTNLDAQVHAVLAMLPPLDSMAWALRHEERLQLCDIAAYLRVSRRGLEKALNRATAALVRHFWHELLAPPSRGFRALLTESQRQMWDLGRRGVNREVIAYCAGCSPEALALELGKLDKRHERYARAQQRLVGVQRAASSTGRASGEEE